MILFDPARGIGTYEDFFPFEGNPPKRPDLFDHVWYPAKFYHDVRLGIDITPKYNFYAGIDNLTNVKPPYNLSGLSGGNATGNGAGESIYDIIGRFYYAGFVAKLGGEHHAAPPPVLAPPPPPPPPAPVVEPAPPPPPPPPPPPAPERG
jgi:hypothetical protein